MRPIFTTVIRSRRGSIDVEATCAYLDDLIENARMLLPYRYALVDVVAEPIDNRVEIYEQPATGDDRLLVLWLPDAKRAGLKAYYGSEWQWTRASNPQDALRRYRAGGMNL